jgi:hypothetical protein
MTFAVPVPAASPEHPLLLPVPEGVVRPFWSVMIPTYNCADYLRQTLASVLAQDPGPDAMQIEVIDDASTADDPEAVVRELGHGRVVFHRQPANVGHSANFRTCLERARGRVVHLLHGDDLVLPGFYEAMGQGFTAEPGLGAAFCRHEYVDERNDVLWISDLEQAHAGPIPGWLRSIAVNQRIQTPSVVVARDVYETLGTFDRRLSWCEDWEMWVRIAGARVVWYEPRILACYRMHGASSTSRHLRSGANLQDVRRAISIIGERLPPGEAAMVRRMSLAFWASDALRNRAPAFLDAGDLAGARAQIREALLCSHDPSLFLPLLKLGPRYLAAALRRHGAARA